MRTFLNKAANQEGNSKQRSPHDIHGPECFGSCNLKENLNVQADRGSNFPLSWKGAHEPKAQTPELIQVSLARSMPRSIATPPHPEGMLVHRRVTPEQYVAGKHTPMVKRDKGE